MCLWVSIYGNLSNRYRYRYAGINAAVALVLTTRESAENLNGCVSAFVTVRQRKGEGNVFSRVCLSTGVPVQDPPPYMAPAAISLCIWLWSPEHVQTYSTWSSLYRDSSRYVKTSSLWSTYNWQAGSWHPTGMLSCSTFVILMSVVVLGTCDSTMVYET